jgi:hypothetical protein
MSSLVHQPSQPTEAKPLRPFRLKFRSPDGYPVGKHVQPDPHIKRREGEDEEAYLKRAGTLYVPGDIVESRDDLAALYPEKFERADLYSDPSKNPFLTQMAPGELPEDFERRMARLKAQAAGENQGTLVANSGTPGEAQHQRDHKQETDISINPVAQVAKQSAHRLAHLKLEQMTAKQLQEIIDSEEIDTGGKTLTKPAEMAKVIRDWMTTSR